MIVTNKSNKIIGIGELTLLPGETRPIPAEFENNPTIKFFIERGTLDAGEGTGDKPAQANPSNAELEEALRGAIAATEAAQKKAAEESEARKVAEEKAAAETKAREEAEAAVKAAEEAKAIAEAKAKAAAGEDGKPAKPPK